MNIEDNNILVNTYKYYCEKCDYGTNIKHSLLQHNNTELHITGQRKKKPIKEKIIFQCDLCDFNSTNNNNYITHKLNNHLNKEERKKQYKFYCDKCDFGVFTQSMIDRHNETLRHKRLNP